MVLDKKTYAQYWEKKKDFSKLEDKIFKRITEVLGIYGKMTGVRLAYWYFHNAAEGEVGTFHAPSNGVIDVMSEWEGLDYRDDPPGEVFDAYQDSVVVDHLFMKDAEIVKALKKEVAEIEEAAAQAKEAAKARRSKKQIEKEKALKKLTPKDRKALGL